MTASGPRPAPGPQPGAIRTLSPARARMLDRLRAQPEPLTLAALVAATGLHENTVREHVDALVRVGLVRRERAAPRGRGRPAWLYQATDVGAISEYAGLATALAAGLVRTAPDVATASAAAEEAGTTWGRELAGDAPPLEEQAEPHRRVVHLLGHLGFEPTVEKDPHEVRLTRCPLLQAAVRHPEVVCAVHLGIVRGALTEYDTDPAGTELHPFAEPGACRLVLPHVD